MRSAFYIAAMLLGMVAMPVEAQARWMTVRSVQGEAGLGGERVQASLLQQTPAALRREDRPTGNTGSAGNRFPRKLVIERIDAASGAVSMKREYRLPAQTQRRDRCSIVLLDELAFREGELIIGFDHQYACGVGQGTLVRYILDLAGEEPRMSEVSFERTSRDGLEKIHVDYSRGAITMARSRMGDEHPRRVGLRRVTPGKPALAAEAFVACPQPLRGTGLPDCRP